MNLKKDKSVGDLEISVIDIKFVIIFISHFISDIIILDDFHKLSQRYN